MGISLKNLISRGGAHAPFAPKVADQTVIGIDVGKREFLFYTMTGGDTEQVALSRYGYTGQAFGSEFYAAFAEAAQRYVGDHPAAAGRRTVAVLPDFTAVKDLITLPVLSKKAMDGAFRTELSHVYQNADELKINSYTASKNKQYAVYVISAMRKEMLTQLYTACSLAKLPLYAVTYAASAASNAVAALAPKYRTASYLILDVREDEAHIAFVGRGRAIGSASLPFGWRILALDRVSAEDLLFDHSSAEIAVLNAKARARAKQLTLTETEIDQNEELPPEEEEKADPVEQAEQTVVRGSYRKTARRLPKYMLREYEPTPENIAYENFRLFVKWTLLQIRENEALCRIGKPGSVLVQIPEEYAPLLDRLKKEEEAENAIEFRLFSAGADGLAAERPEIFGGFFADSFNPSNNF